jgi:hypothetical protein
VEQVLPRSRGWGEGRKEVAQAMYTYVYKCKNDKINLHEKNFKTLRKEIKRNINKWVYSPCSRYLMYRLSEILIKNTAKYFVDTDKLILKFTWKSKRPRMFTTLNKKNNKVRRLVLPDLKTYKSPAIKTVLYWEKNRQIDQWNKI